MVADLIVIYPYQWLPAYWTYWNVTPRELARIERGVREWRRQAILKELRDRLV